MPSPNSITIRQMIMLGMMIALALVLSYFERFIPLNFTFPGIKLGLANVVTLLAVSFYKNKHIYFLVVVRVLLASLMIGSMMSLWYSLAGGLLSATVMIILSKYAQNSISMIGMSVMGAIFHNLGQVTVVMIITDSIMVGISYFPILLVSGIITGIFIGYVAKVTKPYLYRLIGVVGNND